MAEHLRGSIYEGPSTVANQVVSNLSGHGRPLYLKGGIENWNSKAIRSVGTHGVTHNAGKYQFARRKAYLNALSTILPKKIKKKNQDAKICKYCITFW